MMMLPTVSRRMRHCLAVCALFGLSGVLLGGCLSGPPPARYLLEPATNSAAVASNRGAAVAPVALGLRTVTLPGYVKDSAITARGTGRRLSFDEGSHWAETPDAAVTRVLAESIRRRSGGDVLVEPLPRGFDPAARIEVVFDQLLGNQRGGVDIGGQVRLISGDGRRLDQIVPFGFNYRAGGEDYSGYFASLAVGLDDLAKLITERLAASPG